MHLGSIVLRFLAGKNHKRLGVRLCIALIVVAALTVSLVSMAAAVTSSFPDVPSTHPYYAAISDLAARGIINGLANGNFGPGDPVTRQQFAKMIVLTGGYPVSEADVCYFTDVQKGGYDDPLFPDNYIAVCAAQGITTGKTATTFDPSGKITRYQAVTMVVRAASNLQPGLLVVPPASFTAAWTGNAVHSANAAIAEYNGLLAGLDLAALDPNGNMSRGEVAQILHNLLVALTPATTTTSASTTTSESTTTTSSSTTTTTTVPPGLAWTGHALITNGGTTDVSPAIVVFNGKLYLFSKGINDDKLYYNVFDGSSWSGHAAVPNGGTTDVSPAVAVFNGKLYIVAKGIGDKKLYVKTFDGSTWTGYSLIANGGTTDVSPAIVVFNGKLYLFSKGITDKKLYVNSFDGSSWSGYAAVPNGGTTDVSPAIVVFNGKVYLITKGINDDKLYVNVFDGSSWTGYTAVPNGGTTDVAPVIAAFNGKLYVFAKGVGDDKLYVKTFDGSTWTSYALITNGGTTDVSPAIVVFNGKLYLFSKGIGDKKLYVNVGTP